MHCLRLSAVLIMLCGLAASAMASTHRLYDGITAFVPNPTARTSPSPSTCATSTSSRPGRARCCSRSTIPTASPVVREVIPDDGVTSQAFLPPRAPGTMRPGTTPTAHMKGTQPMIRWSAFSAPIGWRAVPKRTFTCPIKGGKKGVYRVLLVGAIDHYVTLKIDPELPYAVAGHPDWLHGHGEHVPQELRLRARRHARPARGAGRVRPAAHRRVARSKTADGKVLFDERRHRRLRTRLGQVRRSPASTTTRC